VGLLRKLCPQLDQFMKDSEAGLHASAWPEEPLVERLENCRVMLATHGIITHNQSERITKQINLYAKRISVKRKQPFRVKFRSL